MLNPTQTLSFDTFSLLAGTALGACFVAAILIPLWLRARHGAGTLDRAAQDTLRQTQDQFLALAQEKLKQSQMEGSFDLEKRQKAISDLVDPIAKTMKDMETRIEGLGKVGTALDAQLKTFTDDQRYLREQTQNLVQALRSPTERGRWGEMQLQRAFEVIGFTEGVHFHSQKTVKSGEGATLKPDFVVSMPNGVQIVIDVKTPLDPYWELIDQTTSSDQDAAQLTAFRQKIRDHLKALSAKDYWRQFDSPEFVVMFLPSEGLYSLAISQDQGLLEEAARANIILASPTTVMGLLRVVMYGWQQQSIASEAKNIAEQATELYRRIASFGEHFSKLGRSLGTAMGAYNDAVGSLEKSVLPTMRKFRDMKIPTGNKEIPALDMLEQTPRSLVAPELTIPDHAANDRLDADLVKLSK